MSKTNVYSPMLKNWSTKQLGSKPTDELLNVAHAFGRPGKQSLALALAMRPEGVSGSQIVMVCGAPQNNHRRGLIAGGLFKREPIPANEQGHSVYKIKLTAKGEAAIKRAEEAASKAALNGDVKSKKPKAKKSKDKPALQPAPQEPAPTTEAAVTQ